MTSLATKRRTVSTISRRTSGSVGLAGARAGRRLAMGEPYSPLRVDVDLISEKNVSDGRGPDAPRARAGCRRGSVIATPCWRGTECWSFRELDDRGNAFARHLGGRGVAPGDRVAVMMSNRVEFVVAVHAISKLGAASVLLSPAWKARRGRPRTALTAPVHAVADGAAVELLGERWVRTASPMSTTPVRRTRCRPASERPPGRGAEVGDTDEAVLVFSSGTTGLPKAVRHTHRSIGQATAHWCEALGLGPDDRFQVATPPSHILGPAQPAGRGVGRRHGAPAPPVRPGRGAAAGSRPSA